MPIKMICVCRSLEIIYFYHGSLVCLQLPMFSSFVKFDKLNFNEVFFTTGITRQSKYGKEINEQQFVQELTSSLGEIWDLEHKI